MEKTGRNQLKFKPWRKPGETSSRLKIKAVEKNTGRNQLKTKQWRKPREIGSRPNHGESREKPAPDQDVENTVRSQPRIKLWRKPQLVSRVARRTSLQSHHHQERHDLLLTIYIELLLFMFIRRKDHQTARRINLYQHSIK